MSHCSLGTRSLSIPVGVAMLLYMSFLYHIYHGLSLQILDFFATVLSRMYGLWKFFCLILLCGWVGEFMVELCSIISLPKKKEKKTPVGGQRCNGILPWLGLYTIKGWF